MNKVVLLLLLSTVGLGLISLHLTGELRTERTERTRNAAAFTSHVFQVGDGGANAATPATYAVAQDAAAETRSAGERQAALMRDPGYRAALLDEYRYTARSTHEELARELALPSEQFDHLVDLLAKQQLAGVKSGSLFWTGAPDDEAGQEAWARTTRERFDADHKEIAALLGPEKWREYQQYEATSDARLFVQQMRLTLAESGDALRPEQSRTLVQMIHEANRELQQKLRQSQQIAPPAQVNELRAELARQERQLALMREHDKRLREQAAGILDEKQLAVLTDHQNRWLAMFETHYRLNRAEVLAEERGDVPPAGYTPGLPVGLIGAAIED